MAATPPNPNHNNDNMMEQSLLLAHRLELSKAETLELDLDFAFNLQLQEAMAASLSLLPSTSSSSSSSQTLSPPHEPESVTSLIGAQSEELDRLEQERCDREMSVLEARRLSEEIRRRVRDQKVAIEIAKMSDDDWDQFGDEFELPFGEGSSSSCSVVNANFRLYFKGLVSVESVGDSKVTLTGVGVAICDPRGNSIFQLSKPLLGSGISRQVTEIKALIEGLETAVALDLKRIIFYCDYPPIYQYARHAWQPKGRKVATLMEKVELLRNKFTYCRPSLVPRNTMQLAFRLARDAILSQISRPAESNHVSNLKETCVICLEESNQSKMFSVDGCLHRYCFSCMKQHVEAKLHNGMIPHCPHESCMSKLNVTSCEKFLTPKLIEIMKQRITEASIPVDQKVYCPYPRCSTLMSRSEVFDFSTKQNVQERISGTRKCLKCYGLFCVNCKVPWHKNMTCAQYKRSNPYPRPEDAKLKSLATMNLWRQCVKCNHMIELAEGCYHMTCRCGYQFCYTCGAEWKNKKATCSCPLWDEENIMFDESDFDEEDDDDDDYADSYYSDSDDYI